ncbi:MAG: Rieske (2Fe-2S) protein [Gemmatimonadales bacterium]|jgi:3-phenylpropionate/trans-cinnamate dioxygenase ferredoxin component
MTASDRAIGFTDVASAADLHDGDLLGVTLADGTPVCLYRDRGVIGAVGNVCTHAEFAISDGSLRPDGTIECAWHGARFDCRNGAVRREPAVDPLPVYTVRIEHGRVLVGPALPVVTAEERSA